MSIYEGSFCRCCAADGPSRDLITTYNWMGEEEVYADMLRECFDINMDTGEEDGICGVCITQLRNAFNFKKQVQHTEEQFKNKLLFKGKSLAKVKLEIEQNKTSDSETDALDMGADHDSDPEYEVPIKKEPAEAPLKPKAKRRASAAASKAKKVKTEGETSKSIRAVTVKVEPVDSKERVGKTQVGARKVMKVVRKQVGARKMMVKATTAAETKPDTVLDKVKRVIVKSSENELQKQIKNLNAILKNSNATELDRDNRCKLKCPHCEVLFYKTQELKEHVLKSHEKQLSKHRLTMNNFYAKLDVTDLTCIICSQKCDRLEGLTSHLESVHRIEIQKVQRNLTFEFDFSNGFNCTICSNNFLNYKALSEHMNVHFRYYICEVCNRGYATQHRLTSHTYRHKTGTYKCEECDEVFDLSWKKIGHVNRVHREPIRSFKCQQCPESFVRFGELKKHTQDVHKEDIKKRLKCAACDRLFMSAGALSQHKRKDHLLERNYQCTVCSKAFFGKRGLTHHMVTHTGEKNFQCQICMKAYNRDKTLKEHLKIHAEDKKYACARCGQRFVQKCSWKSHMKSKHDEIVS